MTFKRSTVTAAAVAAVLGISAQAAPQMPAPAVLVEKAQVRPDVASRKYVAQLASTRSVSFQPRISGVVESKKFAEGDIVKEGQLLFEIEDTTYRANVEMAKAKVAQAEADLKYTQHDFERKKNLFAKNAVSELIYDEAERAYSTAQANLRSSKASLMDAEKTLSYTRIYAPYTGRVGKATYSAGNYVTPSSQPLADIVRISPIYARFAISERDFLTMFGSRDELMKNGKVTLTLADNSTYPLTGKITIIDNEVDKATGTMKLWATLDNPDGRLNPGGLVSASLSKDGVKGKPAVTRTALVLDQKGQYLLIVDKDNKVIRRDVTPGSVVGQWQLIDKGLEPGETVIIDGTHKASPGMTVVPKFASEVK